MNAQVLNQRPFYSALLQAELSGRSSKNGSYSLRSFARNLGMDAGALSAILSGRRPLSMKQAQKILERLDLDANERRQFLESVVRLQTERNLKRRDPKLKKFQSNLAPSRSLEVDLFQVLADWYHAAILELVYLEDFQKDPKWIAKALGISALEAKAALTRLFEFGLLEERDGKVVKCDERLELADPYATSAARRRKQKQIRQKAIESIEQDPVEARYMTTITMCIDPDLLAEARRRIDEFNDSLCAFLESGKRKQVYTMEIGIFPLQKLGEKK